jgi:hypothetical protein
VFNALVSLLAPPPVPSSVAHLVHVFVYNDICSQFSVDLGSEKQLIMTDAIFCMAVVQVGCLIREQVFLLEMESTEDFDAFLETH